MSTKTVKVQGKKLRCLHCGHEGFSHQTVELERAFGSITSWAKVEAARATVYVCGQCGFLHWFFAAKDAKHEDGEQSKERGESADVTKCLSCGHAIPPGANQCAACGWSWEAGAEKSE